MEVDQVEKPQTPLAPSITVKLYGSSYTIPIPTNGHLIDIESMKARMTGGQHYKMIEGGSQAMQAWLLTEAIATISILIPDVKDSNKGSLANLTPIESRELTQVYVKQISPWLQRIQEEANRPFDEETKK